MAEFDGGTRDRFRGALLGTLVGDALGMPLEGAPASGPGVPVRDMLEARAGRGTGTDDTQLTVALAEALLGSDPPCPPDLDRVAHRFAAHFDPARGYGGNARRILAAIREGEGWRPVMERHGLPGGSFANGSAMRAAPAALAGFPHPAAAARIADDQGGVTGHTHPASRFGARIQAVGVLAGLTDGADGAFDLMALLRLAENPGGGECRAEELAAPDGFSRAVRWAARYLEAPPEEAARALGTGSRADASVPAALWAVASRSEDPEDALVTAVNLGGDADTIGAMAGALAGARHGASAFPKRWVEPLEEGPMGKTRLLELADAFYDRR